MRRIVDEVHFLNAANDDIPGTVERQGAVAAMQSAL
jgi:hypothetical protein